MFSRFGGYVVGRRGRGGGVRWFRWWGFLVGRRVGKGSLGGEREGEGRGERGLGRGFERRKYLERSIVGERVG